MTMSSTDDIIIRRLGPDDVDAFRRIRLEALRLHPTAFVSTFEDWARFDDSEWLRRLTDNPAFAAFDGAEPVALMGYVRERSSNAHHRATVVMVYVREAIRGAGLAKRLLDVLTRHARAQGIDQLELGVAAQNEPARRLYEREGYTVIGRIPSATIVGGVALDEVLMMRRID
ncbi:N-acetyltransferase family protein [Aliihoeflea sp. PC F10.4]